MSKAEVLQQLKKFSREDLQEVALQVEVLLQGQDADDVTDNERTLLDERIARNKANPGAAEDWLVVRDRVLKR